MIKFIRKKWSILLDNLQLYADKRQSITLNLSTKLLNELAEYAKAKYGIKKNMSDSVNLAMLIALYGYSDK